jgi:hypothetical protein
MDRGSPYSPLPQQLNLEDVFEEDESSPHGDFDTRFGGSGVSIDVGEWSASE